MHRARPVAPSRQADTAGAKTQRDRASRYSLTAVPLAVTINMPPPLPIWIDS